MLVAVGIGELSGETTLLRKGRRVRGVGREVWDLFAAHHPLALSVEQADEQTPAPSNADGAA